MTKLIYALLFFLLGTIAGKAQTPSNPSSNRNITLPVKEKRYALVVGNANYRQASSLRNPLNDARCVANTLSTLCFDVDTLLNADKISFHKSIQRLAELAKEQQSVILFYFAGHGLQLEGENWLLPIDAKIDNMSTIQESCISLKFVLKELQKNEAKVNILILDACRNNPYNSAGTFSGNAQSRSITIGLANPLATLSETLIAFSTAPNTTSPDGDGMGSNNSPYTKALCKQLSTPKIKIEETFKQVRHQLKESNQQISWEHSSLTQDFYFNPQIPCFPEKPNIDNVAEPKISQMVEIEVSSRYKMGDSFNEGSNDEKNGHSLTCRPFLMDNMETTFAAFDAFCEATGQPKPKDEGWGRGNMPVIHVSWLDAVTYANWRSTFEGFRPCYIITGSRVQCNWNENGYRLPTEAEWEYAAAWHAQEQRKTRFGNAKDVANPLEMNFERENYKQQPVPVGSFAPNTQGLYDMSGNVWEWCWDWYSSVYNDERINPRGVVTGLRRVMRGGSWGYPALNCRAANRSGEDPAQKKKDIGFRLVRNL